jgi:uncharacterized protein (DUF1800 family)
VLAAGAANWSRDDATHLLRRTGFGGTPAEVDRLHAMGKAPAVDYLIHGNLPPGAEAPLAAAELTAFQIEPAEGKDPKSRAKQSRQEVHRLRTWWLDRMARTDRPLEEKMSLFWHGLLTSGVTEVRDIEMIAQQNALFHEHALGNYKALIHAIIRDPAMLRYLNNDRNVKGKPNENLARELLELFTMGEGNGYTEQDIKEIARALTGATVDRRNSGYAYRPFQHDNGQKTIFGKTGNYEPADVVELIFQRKEPAFYLAKRLWTFFGHPEPTKGEIQPVAEALLKSKWELKPAMRALFLHPNFYSDRVKYALIKSPVELAVGTMRSLEVEPGSFALRRASEALNRMGQQLFQPPNVRGWPGGETWITSATLYTRYNFTATLINNPQASAAVSMRRLFPNLPANPTPEQLVDAAIQRFAPRPLHESKKAALLEAVGEAPLTPSGETDRRVKQLIALLLSTPEYQVQ